MRSALIAQGLALATLMMLMPACTSRLAGPESIPTPGNLPESLSIRQIDGMGNPLQDADSRLRISDSGVITVTASHPDSSLFIEVAAKDPAPGLPQLSLSAGLADSAILLVQPLSVDRLQVGLSMIGETNLPLDQPLLVISATGSASPPQRMASVTPNSPVVNLAFSPAVANRLEWTYYNNGDYDQNGQVTIGDITPLGLHFGKKVSSPNWNVAKVADGDLNGENNVSDLTPIGINFGSSVQSFAIYDSASEGGPFAAFPGGSVSFASASQPPGGGPIPFQMDLQSPTYKNYFMLRVHDGISEALQNSNVVQYEPANQPPVIVASHDALPLNPPGALVNFDASGSSDPDGSITAYHWDYEGDGNFIDGGLSTAKFHYYSKAGSFTPVIRAYDNGGAFSESAFDPIVIGLGITQIIPIDNSGNVLNGISAAYNGNDQHVVSWSVESGGNYSVAQSRSTSSAALNFTAPSLGGLYSEPFLHFSLLLTPGEFGFYYHTVSLGDLRLSLDPTRTGDSYTIGALVQAADLQYDFGKWVSAALVDNDFAAVYAASEPGGGYGKIRFTGKNAGMFNRTISTTAGYKPSLAVVSGNPACCFTTIISDTNHQLQYNRSSDGTGNIWPGAIVVVSGEDVETAQHCMISGFDVVVIVYWSDTDDALRAVASLDKGNVWGSPVTIDVNCDTDDRYVVKVVNGFICVAYARGSEIRICYQSDFLQNVWNAPITAHDTQGLPGRLELLDRQDWPMVYYVDQTNGNLNALHFGP